MAGAGAAIAILAIAGTAGYAAAGGFSSPSSTDVPDESDAEGARRRQLLSEHARKGRQASILTSGKGLLDEPIVSKPVLLGT